jgi:ATP adenylyltransferase
MDRLWSPWRLEYVTGKKSETCVFCLPPPDAEGTAPGAAEQHELIVFEGRTAFVILNLYPYNNGHLLVVPNRHVPTLAALTPEELQEIALLSQRCELALTEAYTPQGINVGINLGKPAGAGVEDHLHVHLVPRWNGDTNFMTVVGEMRVLPEDLKSSAARLRPIFTRLAGAILDQ